MHCGNPLRRFRRLPQRLAQFVYPGLQDPLAHRRLRPEGVEEGRFGHDLAGVRHQIGEEVKGFGPQGHWLLCTPQSRIGQIEPEGSKVPWHRLSLPCRRPQRLGIRV